MERSSGQPPVRTWDWKSKELAGDYVHPGVSDNELHRTSVMFWPLQNTEFKLMHGTAYQKSRVKENPAEASQIAQD